MTKALLEAYYYDTVAFKALSFLPNSQLCLTLEKDQQSEYLGRLSHQLMIYAHHLLRPVDKVDSVFLNIIYPTVLYAQFSLAQYSISFSTY